jgi:rhodanese-related sulfurtransferase
MSEDSGFRRVNVEEAKRLIDDEGYELVDVRDDWEWQRGHIPGARNVALGTILADPRGQKFGQKVVFQCLVGERSAVAAEMAVALGVPDVVNMEGGFNAWKAAGLPVEKP